MTKYEGDFSFKLDEFGTIADIEAIDVEDADAQIMEYVRETYPDASNISVDAIREMAQ